jgi:hypothetical protein
MSEKNIFFYEFRKLWVTGIYVDPPNTPNNGILSKMFQNKLEIELIKKLTCLVRMVFMVHLVWFSWYTWFTLYCSYGWHTWKAYLA